MNKKIQEAIKKLEGDEEYFDFDAEALQTLIDYCKNKNKKELDEEKLNDFLIDISANEYGDAKYIYDLRYIKDRSVLVEAIVKHFKAPKKIGNKSTLNSKNWTVPKAQREKKEIIRTEREK